MNVGGKTARCAVLPDALLPVMPHKEGRGAPHCVGGQAPRRVVPSYIIIFYKCTVDRGAHRRCPLRRLPFIANC
jgi:hypothetical protein